MINRYSQAELYRTKIILPVLRWHLTAQHTTGPSSSSSSRRRIRSHTDLAATAAASASASCRPVRLQGPSAASHRTELLPLRCEKLASSLFKSVKVYVGK